MATGSEREARGLNMDDRRFDDLARLLGTSPSRRRAARAVVGGALAAGLALLGAPRAEAGAGCVKLRNRCNHDMQCCTRRCQQGRCRR